MKKQLNTYWICRNYVHITEAIVLIKNGFWISQEAQWFLDELEKICDLHFVITKGITKRVDPKKFSEAHLASSYSITPDETGISGILGSIEYDQVLYKGQHLYYFVIDSDDLRRIKIEDINKTVESSEILKRSIFKVKRLVESELIGYYTKHTKWYEKIDRSNTYSTHIASSSVFMIQVPLYNRIKEYIEDYPGYQETFLDFPRFLGSIVMRLDYGTLLLNKDIKDVKISTIGIQS